MWSSSRFLQCRDCAPVRASVTGPGCRRNRAIPARWGRDIRPRCPSAARAVRRPTRYAGFSGWTRDAAATARSPSVTPADGHVVAIGTPPGDRRRSAGCADRVVRDGNRDLGPSRFVTARRTCGWAASLSAAVTGEVTRRPQPGRRVNRSRRVPSRRSVVARCRLGPHQGPRHHRVRPVPERGRHRMLRPRALPGLGRWSRAPDQHRSDDEATVGDLHDHLRDLRHTRTRAADAARSAGATIYAPLQTLSG